MQVRINKFISESGYCSRREADKFIENGGVTIDGKKAEMGSQVSPGQVVKVFGETIRGKADSVILAYNKPVGIVSTTDPAERDNVVNAIAYPDRIFPIGRLDKDSQGLLLLTNEGDIVNKILRVNNHHDKEYFVTVDKAITPEFIKRMQGGIPILGIVTRKCEITQKTPNSFTIVLRQGLNRQIRRMCEYLGYNVTKLQRTRVMHILLNDLKVGQYRNLTPSEIDILYKKIEDSVKTEDASVSKTKVARRVLSGKTSPAKSASAKSNSNRSRSASDKPSFGKTASSRSASDKPSFGKPASSRSVSDKPLFGKTASSRSASDKPSFGKPASSRSASDKPSFGKPASSRSASDKPSFGKPASSRSASDKPSFGKPASSRSASDKPLFGKPASSRSASDKPSFAKSSSAKQGPKSQQIGKDSAYKPKKREPRRSR